MNCDPDPRPLGEAVVHVVVLLQVQDQGQTSHVEMCVNILMFFSMISIPKFCPDMEVVKVSLLVTSCPYVCMLKV